MSDLPPPPPPPPPASLPPSGMPGGGAPPPPRALVRNRDLVLIMLIAAFAALLLVAFGYLLNRQGLLVFPDVGAGPKRGDMTRYFQDALDYRERRMTLALILRTFITGISFVVGLALCTQGGIFILRQVTAFTALSAQTPGAVGRDTSPPGSPLFSFASYSPGVVFLVGGVVLMVATQYLSIQIQVVEIVPPEAVQLCQNEGTGQWERCQGPGAAGSEAVPPGVSTR